MSTKEMTDKEFMEEIFGTPSKKSGASKPTKANEMTDEEFMKKEVFKGGKENA